MCAREDHLTRVRLYGEPREPGLDLEAVASYLRERLPRFRIDTRESLLEPAGDGIADRYALGWAQAKVRGGMTGAEPLPGEIAYERRRLSNPESAGFGLLYDAHYLLHLGREILPPTELGLRHIHVAFTRQLLGTLDEGDGRYHARVAVFGCPSLISTVGAVEAPARPRDHYLVRGRLVAMGMGDAAAVEWERVQGRFLRHGDPRLTEVLKGYALQAVAYQLTGEAFCADGDCRFYNAHWQEELVRAQLEGDYEFCPQHERLVAELGTAGGRKEAAP